MKNRRKIVLTANQRCQHHTESLLLRFFSTFFFVDKVGWSLNSVTWTPSLQGPSGPDSWIIRIFPHAFNLRMVSIFYSAVRIGLRMKSACDVERCIAIAAVFCRLVRYQNSYYSDYFQYWNPHGIYFNTKFKFCIHSLLERFDRFW